MTGDADPTRRAARPATEDLIARLAALPVPPPPRPGRAVGRMAAALALGLGLLVLVFGLRPDLGAALAQPVTLAKTALPLALAAPALWLAFRSARPGAVLPLWPLGLPALAAVGLVAATAAQTPPAALVPALLGDTAAACLVLVLALALLPLRLGLDGLSRGACLRPALSGGLMGLAAGGVAAAGYALHCTEDSPLFFVTWYGLAILLCGGLGAVLGARRLRW